MLNFPVNRQPEYELTEDKGFVVLQKEAEMESSWSFGTGLKWYKWTFPKQAGS